MIDEEVFDVAVDRYLHQVLCKQVLPHLIERSIGIIYLGINSAEYSLRSTVRSTWVLVNYANTHEHLEERDARI